MNPVESFNLNGRKLIKYLAILLITLLIGAIFLFILIYIDIRDELQKETEQAIEYSILYSPIEEALETYTFNGEKPYDVIKGENESGESLYVFIPKNLTHTDEIKWIEEEAGLKKDDLLNRFRTNCSNCSLIEINPGILNNQFVWEVIYEQNDRMYFQTYRFSNGELYDSISFRK